MSSEGTGEKGRESMGAHMPKDKTSFEQVDGEITKAWTKCSCSHSERVLTSLLVHWTSSFNFFFLLGILPAIDFLSLFETFNGCKTLNQIAVIREGKDNPASKHLMPKAASSYACVSQYHATPGIAAGV